MAERIDTPPTLAGDEKAQLQQLWSYLYQMSQALNNNLEAIGGNELTDSERAVMQQILSGDEVSSGMNEMETLKSLIIKTADFVQTSLMEYRLNLLGSTVASGQFGRYVRNTGLNVEVNPEGITQNYTFEEVVQGLKHYEINAKNYIKTGLLRTVSSIPVYGVAIGKDVVTFAEDGTETYVDGNKVAELTADELSFWQNGTKVAGYTGSRISFYYNGTECFYIQNGKMYAAADFEINSGKKLKIGSGGVLDVDTNNFKIDSTNKTIKSNNFTFDSTGITYTDNEYKLKFGKYSSLEQNVMAAVMADMDNAYNGILRFIASPGTTTTNASLELQCIKRVEGSSKYARRLLFKGNGTAGSMIGCDDFSGGLDYAQIGCIVTNSRNVIDGSERYGGVFDIILDPYFNPIRSWKVPNGTPMLSISHNADTYNGSLRIIYFNNLNESNDIKIDNRVVLTNLEAYNVYYTNLVQNSSREIKHNIRPLQPMGEKLDRLQPVTFVYDEDENETQRMGLIYEDTVEVMPEICTRDESDKAINYVELIPALLKEIQELRARVAELERRMD
jgi:hypothetical protein